MTEFDGYLTHNDVRILILELVDHLLEGLLLDVDAILAKSVCLVSKFVIIIAGASIV